MQKDVQMADWMKDQVYIVRRKAVADVVTHGGYMHAKDDRMSCWCKHMFDSMTVVIRWTYQSHAGDGDARGLLAGLGAAAGCGACAVRCRHCAARHRSTGLLYTAATVCLA